MSVPGPATSPYASIPRRGWAFGASVAALTATFITTASPIPLYNTYHEAWRFAEILREMIV